MLSNGTYDLEKYEAAREASMLSADEITRILMHSFWQKLDVPENILRQAKVLAEPRIDNTPDFIGGDRLAGLRQFLFLCEFRQIVKEMSKETRQAVFKNSISNTAFIYNRLNAIPAPSANTDFSTEMKSTTQSSVSSVSVGSAVSSTSSNDGKSMSTTSSAPSSTMGSRRGSR